MDLIKIYEANKKEREKEKQQNTKIEINRGIKEFLSAVIKGNEYFYTSNKELLKKLNLSYKKRERGYVTFGSIGICDYQVKINKTNVEKVQQYLNKQK